jgi:hypothetical protein
MSSGKPVLQPQPTCKHEWEISRVRVGINKYETRHTCKKCGETNPPGK